MSTHSLLHCVLNMKGDAVYPNFKNWFIMEKFKLRAGLGKPEQLIDGHIFRNSIFF